MAPSLQASYIPIHLLLHWLMTRSHGLNLGKGSFGTPCLETRALDFKSTEGGFQPKVGQKGSTALKQISSSVEAAASFAYPLHFHF